MTGSIDVRLQVGSTTKQLQDEKKEDKTQTYSIQSNDDWMTVRQQVKDIGSSIDHLEIILSESELETKDGTLYSPMELANWVSLLMGKINPSIKSTVSVQVVPTSSESSATTTADFKIISTSFLLAGLTMTSERKETNGIRIISGTIGGSSGSTSGSTAAAAAVAIPKKKQPAAAPTAVSLDTDDLIDEDELLNGGSDVLLPEPPAMNKESSNTDDCSGRKACDNCTCGRADQEKNNSEAKQEVKTSSCGKCGLGDAFRCASCPYLGKPAFKAGEEHLVLQLDDDI